MQFGNWQKISELGSGAFGVVSLWKNNENGDQTAIKMCRFTTSNNLTQKQKQRWHQEVDMMKLINHPNIIKFKKIPQDLEEFLMNNNPTKLPLLSMEYCCKGNLKYVLNNPQNISGMKEEDVRCILEDISSGLQHLHNLKITHRDLKPDNIVIQYSNQRKTNNIYKIIDLGYAKELSDSVLSFVGTLDYLAPEIFEAKNYNNSVDYWSMGILAFKIITGVLPFLPNATPYDRYLKIKQKGQDDICIYFSYSGQITYSSEMKKENLISTGLKQNIEIWLRHVFTYDHNVRSEDFPNNIKTLDYLNAILRKKIIQIFSLFKLELYSYEITESTLVGTLKDWISRDIKVPKTDFILLLDANAFDVKDSDIVMNLVSDNFLYVTGKHFLPEKITYSFPKLIREVMKSASKFNMQFLTQLKSQVIYFISQEKIAANNFNTSFHLYLNCLNSVLNKIKKLKTFTISKVNQLLTKIECYNKLKITTKCDIDLRNNIDYEQCLNYSQRLIASFERSINNFAQLDKHIKCVSNRLVVLSKVTPKIQDIIKGYNLESDYKNTILLIERSSSVKTVAEQTKVISDMTKLISDTIKAKESVIRNKKLKAFSTTVGNLMVHCYELIKWIEDYNHHNEELLAAFEQNEAIHFNIIVKAAGNVSKSDTEPSSDKISISESLCQELLSLPTPYLIQQNQELRYKFEELFSLLECS